MLGRNPSLPPAAPQQPGAHAQGPMKARQAASLSNPYEETPPLARGDPGPSLCQAHQNPSASGGQNSGPAPPQRVSGGPDPPGPRRGEEGEGGHSEPRPASHPCPPPVRRRPRKSLCGILAPRIPSRGFAFHRLHADHRLASPKDCCREHCPTWPPVTQTRMSKGPGEKR